jgi:hypothetical protein
MLISMPTGTSTIFGVFQVIRVSQLARRDDHAHLKGRTAGKFAQGAAPCPIVRPPRSSVAASGANGSGGCDAAQNH